MKLAIHGGEKAIKGVIRPYNPITESTRNAVEDFISNVHAGWHVLSGYLASKDCGGVQVTRLENEFAAKFKVKHAIACNSATSGILAACVATGGADVGMQCGVSCMSMSATAAVPAFLGHHLNFHDVDDQLNIKPTFNFDDQQVIVTNLFGHPAQLQWWRGHCDKHGIKMIEDNAQGILATENGVYVGTIGHVGVFSFNVHKQINAGEGGMVVTNDDDIALRARRFINHGECAGDMQVGLNLRMTEITAVIVREQLSRVEELVESRRYVADRLIRCLRDTIFQPIPDRDWCASARYILPVLVPDYRQRNDIAIALGAEGFGIGGYAPLLCDMPAFMRWAKEPFPCPIARYKHERLLVVELCSIDPTEEQYEQIAQAFRKVSDAYRTSG